MAMRDGCLSLRGTALNALRLINKTTKGSVLLEDLGWMCRKDKPKAAQILIPIDIDGFFQCSTEMPHSTIATGIYDNV